MLIIIHSFSIMGALIYQVLFPVIIDGKINRLVWGDGHGQIDLIKHGEIMTENLRLQGSIRVRRSEYDIKKQKWKDFS